MKMGSRNWIPKEDVDRIQDECSDIENFKVVKRKAKHKMILEENILFYEVNYLFHFYFSIMHCDWCLRNKCMTNLHLILKIH